MAERSILAAAPFPLTLRNFLPTGLVGELERRYECKVRFVSPYVQPHFTDPSGARYHNLSVSAGPGADGIPADRRGHPLDRAFKSVHLTGFALEYPDGSLQNLELSRRRSAQNVVARALTTLAPRRSAARRWLRQLNALYRPRRAEISAAFDRVAPSFVLVASPGHYWLDHFVLDEARRRGIPTVCIVLSWDNLYSRGPMCRRPDHLLVWSEEMRRQAMDVHQFPDDRIDRGWSARSSASTREPVTPEEIARMRGRVGLGPDEPFLAYVCGARTARYDVEDVEALSRELRRGPIATSGWWCVRIRRAPARRTRRCADRGAPGPLAGSD